MYTTFHLKASEIDEELIKNIKSIFGKKNISITIEEDLDETAYLLSSSENRKKLKKSLDEAKTGNFIDVSIGKLK